MKYVFNPSPNLRQPQSTKRIMFELMLGLLAIFLFSLFYYYSEYGMEYALQIVLLMICSLVTAFITESIFAYFVRGKEKYDVNYLKKYLSGSFGWITAIILTLMCQVSIPPFALIVSTFFAIFFGKLLFGGFGNNIFNPAALGRAIIFATFMGASTDVITTATPTATLASNFNWLVVNEEMVPEMINSVGGFTNLFTGWYPGAIGETCSVLILIVGIVLAIRKVIDWRVPTIYLGSIFVLTAFVALMRGVPAYNGIPGCIWYAVLHLLTGGVIFGAVFMLTDPVTSPTSAQGRCVFALGAAIFTVLIRIKANLPEGCLYSILLMNMLTPMIEKALEGKQLQLRKKATIIFVSVAVVGFASVAIAGSAIEAKEPDPIVVVNKDDKEVTKLEAKILSKASDEAVTIYHVAAQGYAASSDPTKLNEFEIIVDDVDHNIESIEAIKIVDTEYVGDKVAQDEFLDRFEGKSIDSIESIEMDDVISGATFSTRSFVRAIVEVQKDLGY